MVVDGVSLRILAEDLAAAHRQITDGRLGRAARQSPDVLAVMGQQLTDATARGAFDADATTGGGPARLPETAMGRPRRWIRRATPWRPRPRLTVELPAAVTDAVLGAVPDRIHGHVNDAMVAALYLALREWRRRTAAATTPTVCCSRWRATAAKASRSATSTCPRPSAGSPRSTPSRCTATNSTGAQRCRTVRRSVRAVRSIKDQLRAVPSHGLSYGALRYLRGRGSQLVAAPQVLFNYLGRFDTADRPWAFADDRAACWRTAIRRCRCPGCWRSTPRRSTSRRGHGAARDLQLARRRRRRVRGRPPRPAVDRAARPPSPASDDVRGHSASDFPRVGLQPADVTELESRLPGLVDVLPLTPAQQGIYFHSTFSRRSDPYVVQQIVDITRAAGHRTFPARHRDRRQPAPHPVRGVHHAG